VFANGASKSDAAFLHILAATQLIFGRKMQRPTASDGRSALLAFTFADTIKLLKRCADETSPSQVSRSW
jgi:hypothetical protein